MTSDKLQQITSDVKDVMMNAHDILEDDERKYDLLPIIASLHNELYKAVTGEYYDYMFHWFNLGCGGSMDDDLWKDKRDEA